MERGLFGSEERLKTGEVLFGAVHPATMSAKKYKLSKKYQKSDKREIVFSCPKIIQNHLDSGYQGPTNLYT